MTVLSVKNWEALKLFSSASRNSDKPQSEAYDSGEGTSIPGQPRAEPVIEHVVVEEPLEIRLGGRHFTLTMRTPGNDEELALGFLLAEGFINSINEVSEIRRVRDRRGNHEPNIIDIILNVPSEQLRERLRRNFAVSSSCGLCGKTSIEALQRRLSAIVSKFKVKPTVILEMPHMMRKYQEVFSTTGGLHAAALFSLRHGDHNSNQEGEDGAEFDQAVLEVLREDVGRHNAVDKVLGYALNRDLLPADSSALMVSGRLSFEIVQKAASAGIPIVAAVSAPSSLAIELAQEVGMTLIGFLRDRSFNVYTHPHRIAL